MLKKILLLFILGLLAVPVLSCRNESSETEAEETRIVTIERGNLTVEITAAGNLALSRAEDLSFDLFYQEGTVEEVLVEEGDTVEEGQVLASLDIDEWDEQLSILEDGVTAAKRQLTTEERDLLQAQINLQTAGDNLKNSQQDMEATGTLELALFNARITKRSAERHVGETQDIYTWPDIETAQLAVDNAKAFLEYALDSELPQLTITYAQARLTAAEAILDAKTNAYDTEEVAIAKLQLEAAEMAEAQAQKNLDSYLEEAAEDLAVKELSSELAQYRLEDAEIAVKDAEKDLEDAGADLDEAKAKSPAITAPFTGFITRVNVEGGDEVLTGTVAIQLADPEKFEADIMVSEMDILQVELGGEAWVEVDAMPGLSLPAKVTHISPTATIQSGVVNYKVKVEIEPLETTVRERQAAMRGAMTELAPGELPDRLKQAIEAGQLTQEQAEEMMGQGQAQGHTPSPMSEEPLLREGLTATVSILVDEVADVLLIPNSAITNQGGQSYVQVLATSGETEERVIRTGITDWQFTEVTGGLSEGEQIVVPGTAAASTTQQGTQRGRGSFMGPIPH
ncbi:MAG: HlyD family efflux transporter periplasmic adaptor subunit [Dehalococcoidales bacterium]